MESQARASAASTAGESGRLKVTVRKIMSEVIELPGFGDSRDARESAVDWVTRNWRGIDFGEDSYLQIEVLDPLGGQEDAIVFEGWDSLVNDPEWRVRRSVAGLGYALDELKNDPDWRVRMAVAKQGYALDELKNDPDWRVRRSVAGLGYALDELKNDPEENVRATVACQGYALDELKDDPNWYVRVAVARQGYALDELKDDSAWEVRMEVARQGYALDQLVDDEDEAVSQFVRDYLEERVLTLEQWVERNPDKCGLPENRRP